MLKIKETDYKGVTAIVLENSEYKMIVLPHDGAKIVSFKTVSDDREYLFQNISKKYLRIREDDDFAEGECSGFDDMFPTIEPVIVKDGLRKGMLYNDHGEICRMSFSYEIKKNSLVMKSESKRLGYVYNKEINEECGCFVIRYRIENKFPDAFQILWAGHCMLLLIIMVI